MIEIDNFVRVGASCVIADAGIPSRTIRNDINWDKELITI